METPLPHISTCPVQCWTLGVAQSTLPRALLDYVEHQVLLSGHQLQEICVISSLAFLRLCCVYSSQELNQHFNACYAITLSKGETSDDLPSYYTK